MQRTPGIALIISALVSVVCATPVWATVVVGVEADLLSPDPALSQRHFVTQLIHSFMYTPLLRLEGGRIQPGLLLAAEPVDALQWELTIDPTYGVSAEELAAALLRAYGEGGMGGYTAPSRDRLPWVADARAVDSLTVRLTLTRRYPSLPIVLTQEYLALPRLSGLSGTGLYKLVDWVQGNRVVLEKRLFEGGLDDRLIFEVIPDATQQVQALVAGVVDILPNLSYSSYQQLRNRPDIEILVRPGTRSRFIELNTTRPPFNDARVRQALNLATDVPALLRDVYHGLGYPIATIVPPTTLDYAEEIAPYGFDPQRAKKLLMEAGYPNGFDFELDVVPERLQEARMLAQMWEAIGLTVFIRLWPDWATLRAALLEGERMAWTAEWNNTSRDPMSVLGAKVRRGGTANYGGYSHPQVERLLSEADRCNSIAACTDLIVQVQKVLRDDAAMVFGYVEAELTAVRSSVFVQLQEDLSAIRG